MNSIFHIDGTKSTPEVSFEPSHKKMSIKGRSFPSEADIFYEKIVGWLKENIAGKTIRLDLELDYFNTPSHKEILSLVKELNKISPESKILWKYDEEDEEMLEVGKNMQQITRAKFEFVKLGD